MSHEGPSDRTPTVVSVVVMGVSGSGKTTVGRLLAERLQVAFGEGDDFHSEHNVDKMAAGHPLDDEDRWPWLEAIGEWLDQYESTGAVMACSALKRSYRDVLRQHAPDVWFLHLTGTPEVMASRIEHRKHHFMPESLVRSQFATLETPGADEQAIAVDVAQTPPEIVDGFLAGLSQRLGRQ
ncbi:MAG: gluconokinase [Nocardioidaceae bacterium]